MASDYNHPEDEIFAMDSRCFIFSELSEMPVRTSATVEKVKL